MCGSGSSTSTGEPLYVENFGYPANQILSFTTSCTCSVEAQSCSSKIKVYFVHFQLHDGGECPGTQKIVINDDEDVHEYTCSENTGYNITSILTSSTNYLTVTLDNPDGVAGGYFWMAFEGNIIIRSRCEKTCLCLLIRSDAIRSAQFRLLVYCLLGDFRF